MGAPMNPHVAISFDDAPTESAVTAMGIDPQDLFVFAYAVQDPGMNCKQMKQAVLAKSEEEFSTLVPVAAKAGVLPVPTQIFEYLMSASDAKAPVLLDDCCEFSRNVQIFAISPSAGPTPLVRQWDAQSVVVLDTDRNVNKDLRHVTFLHIGSRDIKKDCKEL